MASLLDYDFDLDKMLGTTVNPVKGLGDDPNFQTEKNLATGIGVADALVSGWNTQYAPEIILRSLVKAKAGRQGVIDKRVKSYMTQQEILKDTQDIKLNKYKLADAPTESLKLQNELLGLQNKNYLSSIKNLAVKSKFKRLQEIADKGGPGAKEALMELEYYANNPDKYDELQQNRDIDNMEYGQGELSAAKILKLNVRDRKNWSKEQEANFLSIIEAPSVKEAADINLARQDAHRDDPVNVPFIRELNVNEVINRFLKNNQPLTKNKNAVQALPIGWIDANEQYPDGAFKATNGKIYAKNKWDNLGIELQDVYSRDYKRDELNTAITHINTNAKTDYLSSQYGVRSIERTNLALERLLDDPEKFQKLFNKKGRALFKVNEITGNFVAELGSEAQDIANLLTTIAGQQFTNEIQIMRRNNKTGGAVGNVSDKEVEMFKNMAANLRYSGSADELWYQLNLLRGQGKKTAETYIESFNQYYGKEKSDRFRVNSLMPIYTKEYAENYQDALQKARENTVNKKLGNEPKSTIRRVKTVEEARALINDPSVPVGTEFITPDGKVKVK
tara:strand:- start:1174 stop:2859 length:1686 start_codon:yes stop_codon:yes gene_type:complete